MGGIHSTGSYMHYIPMLRSNGGRTCGYTADYERRSVENCNKLKEGCNARYGPQCCHLRPLVDLFTAFMLVSPKYQPPP